MYLIKRKDYFHIEYLDYTTGKVRRLTTHKKSKKEAMQFLAEFSNNIAVKKQHNTQISLIDFRDRYLSFGKINFSRKYLVSIETAFNSFIKTFGNSFIGSINKIEIEDFLLNAYKNAPYSSRQYLRTLKAAFNKAIGWGIIKENPFVGVKLPKPRKNLPIFITLEQFDLLTAFEKDKQLNRLYILAFNTGLRLGELCFLQWNSISFDERLLYVRNSDSFVTKSKAERVVPLNTNSFIVLKEQNDKINKNSDFVFSNHSGRRLLEDHISKRFKKCIRAAGLNDKIHFHTLRHSFASNLAQKGVSLFQIKNLLGHQSITTTEIYSHINNQSLREAVEKL